VGASNTGFGVSCPAPNTSIFTVLLPANGRSLPQASRGQTRTRMTLFGVLAALAWFGRRWAGHIGPRTRVQAGKTRLGA